MMCLQELYYTVITFLVLVTKVCRRPIENSVNTKT